MKIVFNDIPLNYKKSDKYEVIEVLKKFISSIIELEKNRVKIELVINKSLKGVELCNDYCIEQIYNEKDLNRDIRSKILLTLTKIKIIELDNNSIFQINNIFSRLCAWIFENNYISITLDMDESINKDFIVGEFIQNGVKKEVKITNICDKNHIIKHGEVLDIRIYEENPKHKIGYGWGSPMDIDGDLAQKVLDEAIIYEDNKNCLVNKYNNKFYVFRRHINNCYHGYIDDSVPDKIKRKFI